MATQNHGSETEKVRPPGCWLFTKGTLSGDQAPGRSFFALVLEAKRWREDAVWI